MNKQAIYHRPKSNYCYAYDNDTIHLRIRAAKGDLDNVTLVYGDKYDWENSEKMQMKFNCADENYDYFTVEIKPNTKRLAYYFLVKSDNKQYYYTEWGVAENIDKDDIYLHFFQYPYINETDVHQTPQWVKDAVFYQIFPERFYNGDESTNPEIIEKWGNSPERNNYFGGDLKGIIKKIDHLTELGVNAIYLTPIFESYSNHKYNTKDYMKVDPHFGDLETIKELVKECHKRGVRVVLDAVFNHSGYYFEPFQDVIKNGEKSQYYDWFYIKKWPIEVDPPSYDTFAFVSQMPKLNTHNKEVREYLLKVSKYWIEEVDIDGWRLDVSDEISHDFWREFRKVVKNAKEDAYIVGEIWHDSLPWLNGDQFDAIMNYPLMRACIQYIAYENMNDKEFIETINEIQMRNTKQVNEVMLNLLDSHDTSRFLTKSNGNIDKLRLAIAFLLTYTGTPSIYYGTEIGMEGGDDPDCRKTMEWDREKWDKDLFEFTKQLIIQLKDKKYISVLEGQEIENDNCMFEFNLKSYEVKVLICKN